MSDQRGPLNALSFDLEDWYQVLYFDDHFPRDQWSQQESRLEAVTVRLLEILDRHQAKATFFVLGWNAERLPLLIKLIARAGHEIGSHGYGHHLAYRQGPAAFGEDLRRSIAVLEDLTGDPVKGFRAPSFSITKASAWALSLLLEHGIEYDSSVLPARRPYCGIPGAPVTPWRFAGPSSLSLVELPPSSLRMLGRNLPFGGGGYFRLLPYELVSWALRRLNRADIPGIIYLHPWELDPAQPVVPIRRDHRFQHYVNLAGTEAKLERLLSDFSFVPYAELVGKLKQLPIRNEQELVQ